jgi:hypothetical protein
MSYQGASDAALRIRHTGQVFPLTQTPITLGRHADNTVVLSDSQVSRHHASISRQAGTYVIQDLGSANGTYVNEQQIIGPQLLRGGDVVRLGNTLFDVEMASDLDATMKMPLAAAAAPEYEAASAPSGRSALPIIIGLLAAGVVIVCVIIAALLLFQSLRGGQPTVVIQSPMPGAQIAANNEIILQATASGAPNIARIELRVNDFLVATGTSPDPRGVNSLIISQPWTFGKPGPHTVSAVAYTTRNEASEPATVSFTVIESVGQATPTDTSPAPSPTVLPTAEASVTSTPAPPTPTPTTQPPDTPSPEPDTPTPTATATPEPTPQPTPTATWTQPPPPQIEFFWASPDTIVSGGCTTLEWGAVSNATSASIDQGIGGVATPGSRVVCPSETTTYILTATGPGGTVIASATVTVQAAVPDLTVTSIDFVPQPPVQDQDNEVRVTIRNIGTGSAGPFHWEWQPGSAVPLGGHVPGGLNAGETIVVTVSWNPSSWYANLTTVARVDVNNEVAESDETNNELQVNTQVVAPFEETVTLTSQAALDGFRANNGGGNNTVDIRAGNGAMVGSPSYELVTRGFMSFSLSGIPAAADIQSIELRFFQVEIEGNPYGKLGNPLLQHVDYGSTLNDDAYNTPALDSAILAARTSPNEWYIVTSDTIAGWIEEDLAAGRPRCQMRLQFSTETDGDGLDDSIGIESGDNYFGTGNRPELTITYRP